MNRQELKDKIRHLEGLTDDERSALLELLNTQKRYGLVWEDKPEDVEERLRENLPVLTEVKERAIISNNPDAPNHILIEGDNLEALTTLSYTHAGKIDVIYIDPPYNTGNKDFVYYDDFQDEYRSLPYVDKEDAYRHSKWLSFMNRRLRVAKKLLSEDGALFISIDDRECFALKLLCDEIFGADRFVSAIPRLSKMQRAAQEKHMDVSHDYVLCYSKSEDFNHITEREIDETKVRKDSIGTYVVNDTKAILADKSKGYSEGGDYDFEYNGTIYKPIDRNGNRNRWLWTKPRMEAAAKLGILVETGTTLRMQLYLDVKFDDKTNSMVPKDSRLILHSIDFMTNPKFSNATGSKELKDVGVDLFNKFNNPKPLLLINKLISLSTKKIGLTVLDFFAGSGTTMHAVMQLNAEDGGHRQCILVTNNENGICENVTYERNKRVINGYTKPNGDAVESLHNNTLRYYRTELLSRDRTSANKRQLVNLSTDMLCIKEGIYNEVPIIINGKKLRRQYARCFADKDRQMLVIYEPSVIKHIVRMLQDQEVKEPIMVYVFSEGRYAYDDDFASVISKVELCALPDAIYEAYRDVLPERLVGGCCKT